LAFGHGISVYIVVTQQNYPNHLAFYAQQKHQRLLIAYIAGAQQEKYRLVLRHSKTIA
jgi:hypothetical protein